MRRHWGMPWGWGVGVRPHLSPSLSLYRLMGLIGTAQMSGWGVVVCLGRLVRAAAGAAPYGVPPTAYEPPGARGK
jgi:hypothetical protein